MIYYLLEYMAGAYCVFEKTKNKTPNLCEAKCVLFVAKLKKLDNVQMPRKCGCKSLSLPLTLLSLFFSTIKTFRAQMHRSILNSVKFGLF
jgi:hypothetical protein